MPETLIFEVGAVACKGEAKDSCTAKAVDCIDDSLDAAFTDLAVFKSQDLGLVTVFTVLYYLGISLYINEFADLLIDLLK